MKRLGLLFVFLLFAIPVRSQDCDQIVADYAGVLKSGDVQAIEGAAHALIDEGADVRVRTIGTTTNLDMDEKNIERSCVSWQSPNHGRKSSLVVLLVSPLSHKMGIYYGSAFEHALADHWVRIKSDYMGPYFKAGDWAGGFLATESQLAARIKASKDEAVHPAVNTTVNQATDFSGLWTVFMWLVGLGAIAAAILIFFTWWRRSKQASQESREAQRKAIAAKSLAADSIRTQVDHPNFDTASSQFTRLEASVRNDPYAEGLGVDEYNVIASQYQTIADMLSPRRKNEWSAAASTKGEKKKKHSNPEAASAASASGVAASSTANASVMGGYPVPVVIPEPIIVEEPRRRRDPDPEPSWTPDPEPSRSSDGGGSSSWSSDSGSSDSGGSSDFGGGGGDSSGGGGSSDF